MVGAAIRAGPGSLGGVGGWAGAAATFVACVIPLLPCEVEGDPRLYGGGSYHSQTHFVCHYLGVCGQNRGGVKGASFISMSRI